VDLGELDGTLDLTNVPAIDPRKPLLGKLTDVYGTATMPQSVDLKLQSGISPGWLAFGSVKWVDWSVLNIVTLCPDATKAIPGVSCSPLSPTRATSLDLVYRDGWTVSGGIGHKFNDRWSGAAQLAWDRGTTTGLSTQTDTWTLSGGVAYSPNKDFEIRLGGAVGLMTAGSAHTIDCGSKSGKCYEFGDDIVSAVSVSGKLKF
jgi:long-chain fatty acid transport protein